MKLVFATRPSALARWQTQWVINALKSTFPGLVCEEKLITTQGDRVLDKPLPEIGGKGLFTQELEAELLNRHVQAAVHSLKDLPVEDTPGLVIGAIPARAEVRDVLVSMRGFTLNTLPEGAKVGTSSLRRSAQLLSQRPDVRLVALRGNVDTRVRKAQAGIYDAIILAGAGLTRLGLEHCITQYLPLEVMLPAPGQGALAVQCHQDDQPTLDLLKSLDDPLTRAATRAERAFLSGLGGGCSLPVAAYALARPDGTRLSIYLQGMVASLNGQHKIRVHGSGEEPQTLGYKLANQAIAQGAEEILAGEHIQ